MLAYAKALRIRTVEQGPRHTRATSLSSENIQHTVRYIELSPARFKDFWR
jgi:hypothetical protein